MANVFQAPSLYEQINARGWSAERVARSFIAPDQFRELTLARHSVVVGPRGSGKTTLLKMLQPPALLAWNDPAAQSVCRDFSYIGSLVAADVSWGKQLASLSQRLADPAISDVLSIAVYRTHAIVALLETIADCLHLSKAATQVLPVARIRMSRTQEAEFVEAVSYATNLSPRVRSLVGLIDEGYARVGEILGIVLDAAYDSKATAKDTVEKYQFLKLDLFTAIRRILNSIEKFSPLNKKTWAFLFDELEIAPKAIREELFQAQRSVDRRIVLKLSISPFNDDLQFLRSPNAPSDGNDFDLIPLWYPRKEQGFDFSRRLVRGLIQSTKLPFRSARAALGDSEFDAGRRIHESIRPYDSAGVISERFASLSEKDSSFSDYLRRKKVHPRRLHELSPNERAALARKVVSLVALRDYHLARRTGQELVGRSRKVQSLYSGERAILAICEGNPRWIKGLVGGLLSDTAATRPNSTAEIDQDLQAERVMEAARRFQSLLRNYPAADSGAFVEFKNLMELLERIGIYFRFEVLERSFSPDPALTFYVSKGHKLPRAVVVALGRAENAGAIVAVHSPGTNVLSDGAEPRKYRLSYMLNPLFDLPLIMGGEVSLENILANPAPRLAHSDPSIQVEFDLRPPKPRSMEPS